MITVVDVNESVVSNPYPGLSLAEACGQFALEMEQIVNEAQMDILLAEHAYLYENGVEVLYEDENGKANENGKALKERIKAGISAIAQKVEEIWNKIVEWCKDRFYEVKAWFGKIGITQKHVDKASMILGKSDFKCTISTKGLKGIDFNSFKEDYKDFFGDGFNKPAKTCDSKIYEFEYDANTTVSQKFFDGCAKVVFGSEKEILNDIKNRKAEALRHIKNLERTIKQRDDANASNDIKTLKQLSKEQTSIANNASRIYYKYVNECIAIVKGVFANKDVKAGVRDVSKSIKMVEREYDQKEGKSFPDRLFGRKNKEE